LSLASRFNHFPERLCDWLSEPDRGLLGPLEVFWFPRRSSDIHLLNPHFCDCVVFDTHCFAVRQELARSSFEYLIDLPETRSLALAIPFLRWFQSHWNEYSAEFRRLRC
jgi:hypothetical protein